MSEILYISDPPPPPRNRLGVVGLLLSTLGALFTCGLLAPVGLFVSLVAMLRKPRRAATWGAVFGLMGTGVIAGIGLSAADGIRMAENARDARKARAALVEGTEVIERQIRMSGGALPSDDDGTKLLVDIHVPWDQSLLFARSDAGYRVVSSGADTRFGTDDDIVAEHEHRGPRELPIYDESQDRSR